MVSTVCTASNIPLQSHSSDSDYEPKKSYEELFLPNVIMQTYSNWAMSDQAYHENLSSLNEIRFGVRFDTLDSRESSIYSVQEVLARFPHAKPIVDSLKAYEKQYTEKLMKKIVHPTNIYTLIQAALGGPEKFTEYSKYTRQNIFDNSDPSPVRVEAGNWPLIALKCRVIGTGEIKYKCLERVVGYQFMWILKERLTTKSDYSIHDENVYSEPKGAIRVGFFMKIYNLIHGGKEKFLNFSSLKLEEEFLELALNRP